MSLNVRYTFIDPSYWSVSGGNLHNNTIFNQSVPAFVLDPVTVNTLGGTKTTTFTAAQVNTNFKTNLTSSVTIPNAADFTQANFLANGWTVGTQSTFLLEMATFFYNNLSNVTVNPILNDVNLIIAIGTIQGTAYAIPFAYLGNQGTTETVITSYGNMLFTDVSFANAYGGMLFTDVTHNLDIDGGSF